VSGLDPAAAGARPPRRDLEPSRGRALRAWLAVAACIGAIIVFSGDEFSARSTSRIIGPILHWLFPDLPAATRQAIHHWARKGAHVTEYAVLGLLVFRALRFTLAISLLRCALLALAVVLTVSASDEFRQAFITSRTSSIADIGLDLLGGALGVCLLVAAHRAAGIGTPVSAGRRG
jgi:VanZ family protein